MLRSLSASLEIKCKKHFAVRWLLSRRVSMQTCRRSLALSKPPRQKKAAVGISVCRRALLLVHARLKLASGSLGFLFRRSRSCPVDRWLCLLSRRRGWVGGRRVGGFVLKSCKRTERLVNFGMMRELGSIPECIVARLILLLFVLVCGRGASAATSSTVLATAG